jgi:hypothetical protein
MLPVFYLLLCDFLTQCTLVLPKYEDVAKDFPFHDNVSRASDFIVTYAEILLKKLRTETYAYVEEGRDDTGRYLHLYKYIIECQTKLDAFTRLIRNYAAILMVAIPLSGKLQYHVKTYSGGDCLSARYPEFTPTPEMWKDYVAGILSSPPHTPFSTTRFKFLEDMLPICERHGIVARSTDQQGVPGGDYSLPGYPPERVPDVLCATD